MSLKAKTCQKGMTLIELLIVIAVISILLGVSFWGYQQRGDELILRRTTYQVMSDIERAREMAMSSRKLNSSGDRPKGGYGIDFNTTNPGQYIIFADTNQNKAYDGGDMVDSLIPLESKITITDLKVGALSKSPIDIVFLPPSPDVYINMLSPSGSAEIVLALKSDLSKTKKIFINSAGLVWMEN